MHGITIHLGRPLAAQSRFAAPVPAAMAADLEELPSPEDESPPDLSGDDESAGSPPDLSGNDAGAAAPAARCCRHNCIHAFERDEGLAQGLQAWNQCLGGISHEQHLDEVFQLVRDLLSEGRRSRRVWRFLGCPVCRRCWLALAQVSNGTVTKFQRAVREGLSERPQDGRSFNGAAPEARHSVNAFLSAMWDSVAEVMPDKGGRPRGSSVIVAPCRCG